MEGIGGAYHRRSCPYFAAYDKRKEAKGWPGPVFANQMGIGWTKLNAVRACSRCRVRHVKCRHVFSFDPRALSTPVVPVLTVSTGESNDLKAWRGRKRKETCEVLGWKLEPHEATKTIYKYVLPPPRRPLHTPMNSPPKDQRNQPVDPVELSRRLEELSPRRLPSLWPWGPDDHVPLYPIGPQFGEDHPEECWPYCSHRRLNELGFRGSSDGDSFSPPYSLELECQSSSSTSGQLQTNEDFGAQNHTNQRSASSHLFPSHSKHHAPIERPQHHFSNMIRGPNRMSLRFILNSSESG
ncbi:hypothetical protein VP01_132g13 [Puccinia sorghi]|uniref:Uncharacterized protein n=1 Tax=Puccinia sorghi TaxID=27349 RepID=A0A0L6VP76_9BASI|nr:hypothetical protein VP01_132g13 [Puccinia sorghi]